MPFQPSGDRAIRGSIETGRNLLPGFMDLKEFSHIIFLKALIRCKSHSLEVKPFLDSKPHGIFATRARRRPNAIGLPVVRLAGIQGNLLESEDVDIVDGTPILDIKPYVPA